MTFFPLAGAQNTNQLIRVQRPHVAPRNHHRPATVSRSIALAGSTLSARSPSRDGQTASFDGRFAENCKRLLL